MFFPKRALRKLTAATGAIAMAALLAHSGALAQPDGAGDAAASPPLPAGSVGGMGDINLYPKRVVIDARQRIATVGLYNRTADAGDYKIDIDDKMMTADGRLVELASVTDPAERARVMTASGLLRWSPRRVELKGNEAQTVRIMARIPPDLPDGEYRSHFSAVSLPPAEATGGLTIEDAINPATTNSIGVRIFPRFGISIPVIVRVGNTTLKVSISGARLASLPDGRKSISVTLNREGTRSAFGDISVTAPGASEPVALIKGIGIYPEIGGRTVSIPVSSEADPRLLASGTRLTITYTDDDFEPGSTLARHEFTVP